MLKNLQNLISNILQFLLIGYILAFLRNQYRFIYYPVKWFFTMVFSLFFTAAIGYLLLIICLVLGIEFDNSISDLLYKIGTSRNLTGAAVIFSLWLLIIGSFIGSFLDDVVHYIENFIWGSSTLHYDPKSRDVIQKNHKVWNPNQNQILIWNLYGFSVFLFLWFRILSL